GHTVVEVTLDQNASSWVLFGEYNATPVEGAVEVATEGLQSNRHCGVWMLGPRAIMKFVGYKGRSCHYDLYVDGRRVNCPASVLVGLGLLNRSEQPIPEVPAPSGALQFALKEAGLVKE